MKRGHFKFSQSSVEKSPFGGEADAHPTGAWLVSFTDVMALMLTFFVLLFAMSEPEFDNWGEISSSLTQNFNKFKGPQFNEGAQESISVDRVDFAYALDLDYLEVLILNMIGDDDVLAGVSLFKDEDELRIVLPMVQMFADGDGALRSDSTIILDKLSGILNRIKNRLVTVGYASFDELSRSAYDSHWLLAVDRARNISEYLKTAGYEGDIAFAGRKVERDLQVNLPQYLQRRIEIIVMKDDGRQLKGYFIR